jgi:hypothetical protein
MLWQRKRHVPPPSELREPDRIRPGPLPAGFDDALFARHLQALMAAARRDGGVDTYLERLQAKQRLFSSALAADAIESIGEARVEALLETVFMARRRLHAPLRALGLPALRDSVAELLYGSASLPRRLQGFVAMLPVPPGENLEARKRAARLRRAAHDLACELLHFRDPFKYPLMARWVWDAGTTSGALREFVRGAESAEKLAIEDTPESFEGVRAWIAERIEREGIYRDVAFWVDLIQAAAYSGYFRAMTGGVLGSDFTRAAGPEEEIKKLLGIDAPRRGGRSRLVRADEPMADPAAAATLPS